MPLRRALDAAANLRPDSHTIRIIGRRRISIRLDQPTWQALQEIAARERITVQELCTAINAEKPRGLSLTTAVRIAVLRYYRDAATESGHAKARHGKTLH